MLELVTALWLAFIGACIGSFLNVVAYRMPRGMSVVWKPSHCPKCGRYIRPRDNLPVFGWLWLRGRCRDCGEPISPRYAIVEAIMGATFFVLAYVELFTGGANLPGGPIFPMAGAWDVVWNPNWQLIGLYAYHAALLSILLAMALIEQDDQRVPARLFAFAIIVVAVASYNWWFLYPERVRSIRVRELKAPLDALQGVVWGVAPCAAAAVVLHRAGKGAAVSTLVALAYAFGAIGGFLGLHAVVRVAMIGIPVALVVRYVQRRRVQRVGWLLPIWFATLLHIIFWSELAEHLSW